MHISGSAIGPGARVGRPDAPGAETAGRERGSEPPAWDVGVVTVLPEETRALVAEIRSHDYCRERTDGSGARFYEAAIGGPSDQLSIACTQTAEPGQHSVIPAVEALRRYYDPAAFVLVGIAGGIDPSVELGDVVIGDTVVYYEVRKESGGRTLRRGRSYPAAAVQHAVNSFFVHAGHADDDTRGFRVHRGPIGSGEAVVAERHSRILAYLRDFNDKTLAVDTEAAGLAQAVHEAVGASRAQGRWIVVRGISDRADETKDDRFHEAASRNAARTLRLLLPYLKFEDTQ